MLTLIISIALETKPFIEFHFELLLSLQFRYELVKFLFVHVFLVLFLQLRDLLVVFSVGFYCVEFFLCVAEYLELRLGPEFFLISDETRKFLVQGGFGGG